MPGYLELDGDRIVSVHVSDRIEVPIDELLTGIMIDGLRYSRHLRGGGLVATNSFVPDTVTIPYLTVVGPDTRVLTGMGMAGQSFIEGRLWNPNEVSRRMDGQGCGLRVDQLLAGVVKRLLAIEQGHNPDDLRLRDAA